MATVVVIEPWYGGSHRVWADGWRRHSRHEIELLTLPDRNWRWRMRAGAVDLAERFEARVAQSGRPDAVVASSLFDVASFAGLARGALGPTPVALYLHENQVLYPDVPGRPRDDTAGLVNWKSMVAADALWWNSAFHRDAFLEALGDLLARQPEPAGGPPVDELRGRSTVLWPGVEVMDLIEAPRTATPRPVVLWNQRWDHDKNPRAVFSALDACSAESVGFDLVLAGENRGHSREAEWVHDRLGDHIVHEGWLEPEEYRSWLLRSDVVVSAADHEFFGIAIVEAMAAGAVPVLPRRLSFPELVEPRWHEHALYPDGLLRHRLSEVLGNGESARSPLDGLRESMRKFDVSHAAAAHDRAVDTLLDGTLSA